MPNTTRPFDVAVVGGGVIGLAVAWRALQRSLSVVVIERGELGGGTSWVAAGMLAPVSEADPSEQPLLTLGLRSAELYPGFVEELREATGRDPGYLRCGTMMAARDRDEAEVLDRMLGLRRQLGLAADRLLASEVRRREPALAPGVRLGLDIPDDHAVDPRMLTAALAEAVRRFGGEVRSGVEVQSVTLAGSDRVTGVVLRSGERLSCENVVVAAGPWSAHLGGLPAEARIPLHPVKGQIMRLHDPAGPGLLERVLRYPGGYVVPRGNGRYVIGATMEERGFDTSVTAGAAYELLRDAGELLPGITELVIDEFSAGLRPATADNTPALGPGALDGLHWATGHYRGGILLTPVSAQVVVDGLTEAGPVPAEVAASRFVAVSA